VNLRARRRRGLVLLCLAVACGGLAASQVRGNARRVEAQVGSPVPVLVATKDLPPETKLNPKTARGALAVRQVPERFVPADSLTGMEEAIGLRTAAPLAAGSYVTAAHVQLGEGQDSGEGAVLGSGQRVVEVSVAGGDALGGAGIDARVDVLITTEPGAGAGRSYVALEDVELLAARPGAGGDLGPGGEGDGGAAGGGSLASLRVTARQAVFLTAAENFAREIRLLLRPPGDRRKVGDASVESSGL